MEKQNRIEKGFVMGLGLFALGRDKASSVAEEFAKRCGAKDLADKAAERGERERSELEEKITTRTSEVLSKMGFATRADVEGLTRKIGGLAKKAEAS